MMPERKPKTQALPGDLVQITAPGHTFRAAVAMVTETHRWGVGANILAIVDGQAGEAYQRLRVGRGSRPDEFVIVGAAQLMPPEVYKARLAAIETARLVGKDAAQ
jgi:hypothetical protein